MLKLCHNPKEDEGYIVSVNGRCGNVVFDNAILLADYFGPEYGWSIEGWEEEEGLTVAAWMPLPEPYEKEMQISLRIMKALNKQIPKRAIQPVPDNDFICPGCGDYITCDNDGLEYSQISKPEYCERCGQRIDWSKNEV